MLINISASPYHAGKFQDRLSLLRARVRQTHRPVIYVNTVGGQAELVFDGRSMAFDAKGKRVLLAKSFEEDIKCADVQLTPRGASVQSDKSEPLTEGVDEIYRALTLATRDYVEKNRFRKVTLGLSGGIDSALTACIAVDALGRDRVVGVTMPSRFSSKGTRSDARLLAENLGIEFHSIPIENVFKAYLNTLTGVFAGQKPDVTEENLQSRIRGTLLMAISNKFGHLVLTTGNKSEVSTGYCTLYGDTAGGFAVLKDVPKTLVYRLSNWVNKKAGREIIPKSTILRAPSAELKHNQKDQDRLPPYDLLDRVIRGFVEEDRGYDELSKTGINRAVLQKVISLINTSEYKRRQSAPGIKITPKSFGRDRRMPITNRFREF